MRRNIVLILGALLVGQLLWTVVSLMQSPDIVDLERGDSLPYEVSSLVDESHFGREVLGAECYYAFICTTTCPHCGRLARKTSLEQEQPAEVVRPLWFLPSTLESDLSAWAANAGIEPSKVFWISPLKQPGLVTRERFGNIYFTPLRIVVHGDTILDVRPSDQLLAGRTLWGFCSGSTPLPAPFDRELIRELFP